MAADLSIHVFEGITTADLRNFFRNTFGSKYFSPLAASDSRWDNAYERIANTPSVWIGEVSWLKAAVLQDSEQFVPSAVQIIHDLVGENLPVIDDDLIRSVVSALDAPNATGYSVAGPKEVQEFLEQHKGKPAFTVSW